jgi:AcrR family transcriptional regulator
MSSGTVISEEVRDGRLLNGQQTRQRVLDAAIVCVVRDGYAAASTVRIAEAAGVSRGALVHHFQSRDELVAAAVEHLAQRRGVELALRGQDLPVGPGRVAAALDLLWDSFSGDLFKATLELWTAARTDSGLRARVDEAERRIGRGQIELFGELLGLDSTRRRDFEERVQFAVGVMRGLAVLDSFHTDAQARARQWEFNRSQLVEMFTTNSGGVDR